jgi:hypothetical protein
VVELKRLTACGGQKKPERCLIRTARNAIGQNAIVTSFWVLRSGLSRIYVHVVDSAFPLDGFYPRSAWPKVARYAVHNLRRRTVA